MTDKEVEEHNEQYINIRFENNTYKQMKKEIKHDLRMVTVERVTQPDKPTILFNYTNGKMEREELFMKSDKSREVGQKIIDLLPDIEQRHRILLRKNYNQSLNKERVSSFNMGVFTFSSDMREYAATRLEEVLELGIKTIENICKEYDIKLHYISWHMDEEGIPHFHYFTDNFNSKGRTINPKRNKNMGQRLQDLGILYFKDMGFNRGLDKEITKGKHMPIREYKAAQDAIKQNKKLKEENQKLKNQIQEMEELQSEVMGALIDMVSEFYEMGMNYKGKSAAELLKMFQRYFEDEVKFEKLFDKVLNLAQKQGLFGDLSEYERVKASDIKTKVKTLNAMKKDKSGTIKK